MGAFSNCGKQTAETLKEIKNWKTKLRDEEPPYKKLTEVRDEAGGTKPVLTKYL